MANAISKSARMELKTTPDAKEILTQAAMMDGMDLSAFVLGAAMDKARLVLAAHESTRLSREGQLTLAKLLGSTPEPTQAMNKLMNLPALPARKK